MKLILIQEIEFIQISPVLHAHMYVCVCACVFSCNTVNLHNQDAEQIHHHVAPTELLLKFQLLPILNSPSNTLFSISVIFLFLEDSINGVTQYLNFYVLTQQNSLVVHPG